MKPKYLTLEEIEQCANNIVKETDLDSTIRDKFRYLSVPLIARYAYYVIAREQMITTTKRKHTLKKIGTHVGFHHATILNGIKSLESLVASNHKGAPKILEDIRTECAKFLNLKHGNYELNKECKSLLIGLYAD